MVSTAFALAGLGGFNAHGAGFLDTVAECNVVPDLVTATSGQIVLLCEWLQGKKLRDLIINAKLEHDPVGQATVGLAGYPGVFRPAYMESPVPTPCPRRARAPESRRQASLRRKWPRRSQRRCRCQRRLPCPRRGSNSGNATSALSLWWWLRESL